MTTSNCVATLARWRDTISRALAFVEHRYRPLLPDAEPMPLGLMVKIRHHALLDLQNLVNETEGTEAYFELQSLRTRVRDQDVLLHQLREAVGDHAQPLPDAVRLLQDHLRAARAELYVAQRRAEYWRQRAKGDDPLPRQASLPASEPHHLPVE